MLIVRHHHERFDGSGYPDGLRGAAIPIGARIVAIVDVYDALGSDRAYRRALAPGAVADRLQEAAGRTLDGELVTLFLAMARDGSPDRAV
jgi:putative two-component system response regulator